MDSLNGNWGNRTNKDFLYQIAFDFVAQLEEIMDAEGVDRTQLATRVGVSKGRVSQVLNQPGRLRLETVVDYARALKRKVAIVAYDDQDPANKNGPIPPQVFVACWTSAGSPPDMFGVIELAAESTAVQIRPDLWFREQSIQIHIDSEASTDDSEESFDNYPVNEGGMVAYAGTSTV